MAKRSVVTRKGIIKKYLSEKAVPKKPDYFDNKDLIGSHLLRMAQHLKGTDIIREESYHAYNSQNISEIHLKERAGVLTEISIMIIQEILKVKGDLHVAGGFFSSMVSCIDDYVDKEDSYRAYGEKLIRLSYVYQDLVDITLEREVALGNIEYGQLSDVRKRLLDVSKTLAKSENTDDADTYLYEKSCGDKVIGVLFPASQSPAELKEKCAELGRLIGEVGQLVDDILDVEKDLKNENKNYMILSNKSMDQTLDVIKSKLRMARKITDDLGSEAAMWILDILDDLIGAFGKQNNQNKKITPSLLRSSLPLPFLNAVGSRGVDLLLWF